MRLVTKESGRQGSETQHLTPVSVGRYTNITVHETLYNKLKQLCGEKPLASCIEEMVEPMEKFRELQRWDVPGFKYKNALVIKMDEVMEQCYNELIRNLKQRCIEFYMKKGYDRDSAQRLCNIERDVIACIKLMISTWLQQLRTLGYGY